MTNQYDKQLSGEYGAGHFRVSRAEYDWTNRYGGYIMPPAVRGIDNYVWRLYSENQARQQQAANVGGQVMHAQAAEQRGRVGENVAPTAIAETDLAVQVEAAGGVENAAADLIAEAQRAVGKALQDATLQPSQRGVDLYA